MKAKGEWVQIESMILAPAQRAHHLPVETKGLPYLMRLNGYLQAETAVGQVCEIKTLAGRCVKGQLVAEKPAYRHSYGQVIRELIDVRQELQALLREAQGHV